MAGTKVRLMKYGSTNPNNAGFGKIVVNGELIEAQTQNDVFELAEGSIIELSSDEITKKVTFTIEDFDANTVPFYLRSVNKADLPLSAASGEPIFVKDTGELYVGQGPNKPLKRIETHYTSADINVSFVKDAEGRIQYQLVKGLDGETLERTEYQYDTQGNVKREIYTGNKETVTKTYLYDTNGDVIGYEQRVD